MQLNAIGEFDDKDSLDHLLTSLEEINGICVTGIKAKIHALCGRFDQARQSLDQYGSDKTYLSRILISVVERSWNRVIEEVASAFERQILKPRQQLILRMFDARAHYQLALRNALGADKKDLFVPSTGLPGIDFPELEQAYASSLEAMLEAQRLNWPSDIHLIMDVFPSSAMILGRGSEAMPILTALGMLRGNIPSIREIVCKVAVQLDHPEVALQLIDRENSLAKFPYEDSIFAVAALKAGMPHKALEMVTDEFIGNESSADVFLSSLLMLGMAANSAVRPDLLNKISERLGNSLEARNYQAILNSAIKVQGDFLQKPTAIKELYSYWSDNEKPAVIGGHLLINLDTSVRDQAELYIEVASHMATISAHSCEDYYHLGHAHMTMQQLDIAEKILKEALNRFPHDIKIKSLLGVVLEQAGKSPDAFFLFEQLLEESSASELARSYYVNIAIRMGFFNKAEAQIRNGITNARNAKERLSLLGTLFQLLMAEGTRPDLIEGTAWEFGKAANQDNEFEEGAFLQQYLFVTQREDNPKKLERIEEFKERFERFFSKFPDSKVLWRAEMPADGAPADLFSSLLDAVGLTKKDIEVANNIERRMDRGALQVPFSWRPKRFLRNIPDIFMLWEIRRKAPQERAAMHFSNSAAEYSRNVPNNLSSYEAVLSLTSIILLHEIDLLDIVLDTFPKIFIARATLLALQEARSSISGGWGIKRATEIYEVLQKHFTKMSSSPYGIENKANNFPDWHSEELHAISQGERVYFCDDILETYFVCKNEQSDSSFPSISTVDFLTWSDQVAGLISPEFVSEKISNMISKRINSITVIQRYLLSAIPQDLINAKSQSQATEAIDAYPTLSIILSGIWNHFKPFNELQDHFSSNMAYLINNGVSNNEVIVYMWSCWIGAVRFQQEPAIEIEQKIASSFLHVLHRLDLDQIKVGQLWSALWTVFSRCLPNKLDRPEDQFGINLIGNILGGIRADANKENIALDLFEKSMLGLSPGSQQTELFSNVYVNATAKAVRDQLSEEIAESA